MPARRSATAPAYPASVFTAVVRVSAIVINVLAFIKLLVHLHAPSTGVMPIAVYSPARAPARDLGGSNNHQSLGFPQGLL